MVFETEDDGSVIESNVVDSNTEWSQFIETADKKFSILSKQDSIFEKKNMGLSIQ